MSFFNKDLIESFFGCRIEKAHQQQYLHVAYEYIYMQDIITKITIDELENVGSIGSLLDLFVFLNERNSFIARKHFLTPVFTCIIYAELFGIDSLRNSLTEKMKTIVRNEIDYYASLNPKTRKLFIHFEI